MVSETFRKYVDLFSGRTDCYGSWTGGCIRKPVTLDLFREHLNGDTQIGIYPAKVVNNQTVVTWGCTDIDVDDHDAALRIQKAFAMKDIVTWVEQTRKGYHVWLFPNKPIDARIMREAFLVVHKVAEVPPTEVNPKQITLGDGQVGNYVRLPYPNDGSGIRTMIHEDKSKIDIYNFVNDASDTKVRPMQLQLLAEMWKQAPTKTVTEPVRQSSHGIPWYKLSKSTSWLIRHNNPQQDRSGQLFHLACRCAQEGLSAGEIMSVLYDCDRRWGKYSKRHDQEKQLSNIVHRAMQISGDSWHAESPTNDRSP